MKQEFNINNYVEFVLTQRGAEILNKKYQELKGRFPRAMQYHKDCKEGDVYRNQLWVVMQTFGGDNTGLGLETFCKEATISFDVKEKTND